MHELRVFFHRQNSISHPRRKPGFCSPQLQVARITPSQFCFTLMSNRCCGLCLWLPHLNVKSQAQPPRCEGASIMSHHFLSMSDLRRTGDLKINWCNILISSCMWWVIFFVSASLLFYHIFAAPADSWHRCAAALSTPEVDSLESLLAIPTGESGEYG